MVGFNLSVLNPKLRKSSGKDYGFLVDQLSISEKRLAGDGKLTKGDYRLLQDKAAEIRAFPGLNAKQRSTIDVKMADYDSRSRVQTIKEAGDIKRINRDLDEDNRTGLNRLASRPDLLIMARKDAVLAKMNRLDDVIEQLETAGDDSTVHMQEYTDAINEYTDLSNTITEMGEYSEGEPKSGSVFYLTTNDDGEITDVKVGRVGSKTGYIETNGVYGGLKVYGKVNRKEGGNNVFVLGGTRFSGADITTPDPSNPLGFKNNPLLSEKTVQTSGGITRGQKGTFDVIDPVSVRVQSKIPEGNYAEGADGFLYQNIGSGQYRKYTNADREKLGIRDNQVIQIPRVYEEDIGRNVVETIDGSQPFIPQAPATPMISEPQQIGPQRPTATAGRGRARTGGPTATSPATQGNIFQKTARAAGSFLGNLFGR